MKQRSVIPYLREILFWYEFYTILVIFFLQYFSLYIYSGHKNYKQMRDVISSTSKDLKNFTSLQNISRRLTQIPTSINLTKSENVLLFHSNSNMNYTETNQTHISMFKGKKYLTKHSGGK